MEYGYNYGLGMPSSESAGIKYEAKKERAKSKPIRFGAIGADSLRGANLEMSNARIKPRTPSQKTQTTEQFDEISNLRQKTDIENQKFKFTNDETLRSNVNRIKQYEPLANNEANRAYTMKLDNDNRALGNELATKLPYSAFEENLRSMRQAGMNAANMTNSISGAYNSSISRLSPVSMSL